MVNIGLLVKNSINNFTLPLFTYYKQTSKLMKVEAKCPTNNNKTTNFLLTIACETCGRLYVINICDGLVVDNHEAIMSI